MRLIRFDCFPSILSASSRYAGVLFYPSAFLQQLTKPEAATSPIIPIPTTIRIASGDLYSTSSFPPVFRPVRSFHKVGLIDSLSRRRTHSQKLNAWWTPRPRYRRRSFLLRRFWKYLLRMPPIPMPRSGSALAIRCSSVRTYRSAASANSGRIGCYSNSDRGAWGSFSKWKTSPRENTSL